MLRTHSEPWEWLWVWVWSLLGVIAAWWFRQRWSVLLFVVCGSIALVGLCYVGFLAGWWLPLLPGISGFTAAALTFPWVAARQHKRRQLRRTVWQLKAIAKQQPVVGQIALEYLIQTESEENQTLIATFWEQSH